MPKRATRWRAPSPRHYGSEQLIFFRRNVATVASWATASDLTSPRYVPQTSTPETNALTLNQPPDCNYNANFNF